MQFKKATKFYRQLNDGTPADVFPLLCPVRESDWLEGWEYEMIYSESGLIEKDCVFTTPHHGDLPTVWQVTQHDPEKKCIEFVRVTPGRNIVKINIQLSEAPDQKTYSDISYQYTALTATENDLIENKLDADFLDSMEWWEKAINYYLRTREMLKKED